MQHRQTHTHHKHTKSTKKLGLIVIGIHNTPIIFTQLTHLHKHKSLYLIIIYDNIQFKDALNEGEMSSRNMYLQMISNSLHKINK